MTDLTVCETCLDWVVEEEGASAEDAEMICGLMGDEIADHLCEELESDGLTLCACACHMPEKKKLRRRQVAV